MIVYKITNILNNKQYIGQTSQSLKKRWRQHIYNVVQNKKTPLYTAMRKHGINNFKIEEVGGANNLSELNYQEWLLIHKNNTLWPKGYNLKEGGGNGKHVASTKQKLSQHNRSSKQVVNIETGETYRSAAECARKNNINRATLKDKLLGKTGNETPFRYVGMEDVCKKLTVSSKKVININTGEIYSSASECARKNSLSNKSLSKKLSGTIGNNTPFRYLGMETLYKKPTAPGAQQKKQVININTGEIYSSASECARKNNINTSTLHDKLIGISGNNTPFRYVGMEHICKLFRPNSRKVINITTGEIYQNVTECSKKNNIKITTLCTQLVGKTKKTNFQYLEKQRGKSEL